MTVKCLSETKKAAIVAAYRSPKDIDSYVKYFEVSRRTIIRVLEEAGIDGRTHTKKPRVKPVLEVQIPIETITAEDIHNLPVFPFNPVPKLNWFQRTIHRLVGIIAFR